MGEFGPKWAFGVQNEVVCLGEGARYAFCQFCFVLYVQFAKLNHLSTYMIGFATDQKLTILRVKWESCASKQGASYILANSALFFMFSLPN